MVPLLLQEVPGDQAACVLGMQGVQGVSHVVRNSHVYERAELLVSLGDELLCLGLSHECV